MTTTITTAPPATSRKPPTATVTTPAPPAPQLEHSLAQGNAGDDVRLLQERLKFLAFDPGPTDGVFGPATEQAVWAFEKAVLGTPAADVTGVVDAEVWTAMNAPIEITARRPSATDTHLEVYLPEQIAIVFVLGEPRLITHISSGDGLDWCDEVTIDNDDGTTTTKGICGTSITPGGVFEVERKVEGWKNAALGRLYNPVYFNYGIAVHGASNVPNFPASHGCVRIPLHIADYFPSLLDRGERVFVFDGIKEPEDYGAQLPVFDWPDPNYTTTTSTTTTTTTVPATTTTPTTTVPATTTTGQPPVNPATTTTPTLPPPPASASTTVSPT